MDVASLDEDLERLCPSEVSAVVSSEISCGEQFFVMIPSGAIAKSSDGAIAGEFEGRRVQFGDDGWTAAVVTTEGVSRDRCPCRVVSGGRGSGYCLPVSMVSISVTDIKCVCVSFGVGP